MKHWKKRGLILSLAGILAAASLSGCKAESVNNDEVLATVGDSEISFGVANFYARLMQCRYEDYHAQIAGETPIEFWQQEFLGEVYETSIKSEIIENLEEMYLLRQHAEEYDVELTEEDQKAIQKAAADFEEDNAMKAKELVSGYSKYVEEYLTLVTFYRKMEAPMKEGVDEEVSDEEAAQKSMKYVFFSYVKEDGDGGSEDMSDEEKEEVKAAAEKFAKDLKESKDKDIDAIAEEADLEVQTVTFDSETKRPTQELIEAVDKLEEGEVTDVIETGNGAYVGILTSAFDQKATDEKKESIVEGRKSEQYNSIVEQWREETEITVNEELWQQIDFAHNGISDKESQEERENSAKDSEGSGESEEQDDTKPEEASEE